MFPIAQNNNRNLGAALTALCLIGPLLSKLVNPLFYLTYLTLCALHYHLCRPIEKQEVFIFGFCVH